MGTTSNHGGRRREEAEKAFEDYREYLGAEITQLGDYTKLYRHLYDLQSSRPDAMSLAPAFFEVTMRALWTSIVMWTDAIFEPRSQRGLQRLLTFIENNQYIFSIDALKGRRGYPDGHWMLDREPITMATIENHRRRIDSLPSLESFKIRRDRFHAHFDKKYFFDRERLQREAPLKWSDLDDVTEAAADILNYYSKAYDGNVKNFISLNIADVDLLLDRVEAAASGCQEC